jgi:hypothetical protein
VADTDSNEGSEEDGDSDDDGIELFSLNFFECFFFDQKEIENKPLTVLQIASAASSINEQYIEICKKYEQDISDTPLEEINKLWVNIDRRIKQYSIVINISLTF